ncbi:hypothetical protein KKA15_04535 [Patescibacteria group bacterium]|nr:hypothetical protein [Patescibacteria group bacterium]
MKSNKGFSKNLIIIGIAVIILIIVVGWAFFYLSKNNSQQNGKLIGGDKDEHGCLVAAGYSWCEPKQKCLRSFEEPCEVVLSKFFQDLSVKTNINFSQSEKANFVWVKIQNDKKAYVNAAGFKVIANSLNNNDFGKIKNFIKGENFDEDQLNTFTTTSNSSDSYIEPNHNLVCKVNSVRTDFDIDNPDTVLSDDSNSLNNVTVQCAVIND